MELGRRAISALTWTWARAVIGLGLQVVTVAVLARLLRPDDFGVVAHAMVAMRFVSYFAQLGVSVALVQRAEIAPADLAELRTVAVTLGVAFTALGAALSLLVADPLGEVLRLLSVTFALTGLAAVPLGVLRRGLRHGALAGAELVGQVLGSGVVAIALAAAGHGPWAIVVGMIAQQLVVTAAAMWATRADDGGAGFARPTRRSLAFVAYGLRHSWNTFLEFVYYNLEVIVVGRWYGEAALGFYSRAYTVSHLAVEQVVASVVRVLFPVLVQVRGDAPRERAIFELALSGAALFTTVFCAALYAAAPELAAVLFGAGWSATVPLMRVFAFAIPLRYLVNLQSAWLDAEGALRARGAVIVGSLACKSAIAGVMMAWDASLPVMMAAIVIPDLTWQLAYGLVLPRHTRARGAFLATLYAQIGVVAVITGALVHGASELLRAAAAPALGTLVVQVALGAACLGGWGYLGLRTGRLLGSERERDALRRRFPRIARLARRGAA